MKLYKSLSSDKHSSRNSSNSSTKSVKSLQSLDSYIISKTEKKRYLYKFFDKKNVKTIKSNKYNFELTVLPPEYYLWKGRSNNGKFDPSLIGPKENQSGFFANKEIASKYGTMKKGIDLQYKIVKELKLIDIGNLNNIKILWRIISNLTIDKLNSDNNFYQYLKNDFILNNAKTLERKNIQITDPEFLKMLKEEYHSIIIETCSNMNYEYDSNKKRVFKTPTKCERKSEDVYDNQFVDFMKHIDDNVDGWIHYKTELFHEEILIFDFRKHLKYIDYHII